MALSNADDGLPFHGAMGGGRNCVAVTWNAAW